MLIRRCKSHTQFQPRFQARVISSLKTSFVSVGLGGLEPPTSSLSGKRSNHLSYRPVFAHKCERWQRIPCQSEWRKLPLFAFYLHLILSQRDCKARCGWDRSVIHKTKQCKKRCSGDDLKNPNHDRRKENHRQCECFSQTC